MPGSNDKLRVLRRIPEIRFDEELRGYNKHQVDRVLENLAPLADEVDALVERLSEAERRAAAAEARLMESGGPAPTPAPPTMPAASTEGFDETLSKTLLLAQRTADATVQEAQEEAARIRAEAESEATTTREAVDAEAAAMRQAADEERAASIDQANREVAAMIDAARSTIDNKVAEAEAELEASHASTRDELIEQIASLQRARDALELDVEHFEGHLASRREVIRTAISELSEVVEDPERLRTVMPPSPVAEVPDLAPSEPVTIDVSALDTLASEVTDEAGSQGGLAPDLASTTENQEATDANGPWAEGETTWADEPGTDEALSAGLLVDAPVDEGDPTVAVPMVPSELDAEEFPVGTPVRDLVAVEDSAEAEGESDDDGNATSDPFLDELRRVTSEDDDDEALSKFLDESEGGDSKGGWFGRRK